MEHDAKDKDTEGKAGNRGPDRLWKDKKVFLSINRFEKKKTIELALRAFAGLTGEEKSSARLVVAGKNRQVRDKSSLANFARRL